MDYGSLYPSSKRPSSKIMRHIFRLSTLLRSTFILLRNRKTTLWVYFYNPRFSDGILLMRWAKFLRLKVIVDQTEAFSLEGHALSKKEEMWIAKHADLLLVISKELVDFYNKLGRSKNVIKLSLIIDLSEFDKEQVSSVENTIGYLGAFGLNDAVIELVEAFSLARLEKPELKLRLMGYSNTADQLKEMIQLLDLESSIELVGKLESEQIALELKKCSVLVLPRKSHAFSRHGYPNKLGEYFAAKRAVLISDIGGYSHDFEHTNEVYKYNPNDKASLVTAIFEVLSDQELRDKIALAGYAYCRDNFALEIRQDQLARALGSLSS